MLEELAALQRADAEGTLPRALADATQSFIVADRTARYAERPVPIRPPGRVFVLPEEWREVEGVTAEDQRLLAALGERRAVVLNQRDRVDEAYDLSRSVRDERYLYIRNYMPHLIYGQYLAYMFQTPTTRVWKELYDAGKLAPPRTFFWERKPPEELYDLQTLHPTAEHQGLYDKLKEELAGLGVPL